MDSSPIPPRSLNGGLYTGEPFAKDAGYANVPVLPCSAYWNYQNLRTALPPVQALFQIQSQYRPGNNTDPLIPGVELMKDGLNAYCIPTFPCDNKIDEEKPPVCGKKRIISV